MKGTIRLAGITTLFWASVVLGADPPPPVAPVAPPAPVTPPAPVALPAPVTPPAPVAPPVPVAPAPPAAQPPPVYVPPTTVPGTTPFNGWEFGATGETIFEHTRAGLRDPHFGMRLYYAEPVPGTLSPISGPYTPASDAAAAKVPGNHLFWDVAFGERMPVATYFDVNPKHPRYARGLQLNLEAGVFMLLDFNSQSAGVIDADYRIGTSVDFRPPAPFWEHLSLSVGFFHESTHLGDEYVLSAATIQGSGPPAANAQLNYRANPSYEAVPVTLSVDVPFGESHLSARGYGGVEKYFDSELPNAMFPSVWKLGAELRWTTVDGANTARYAPPGASLTDQIKANVLRRSTGVHRDQITAVQADKTRNRRGAFAFEAAYELLARRRYEHVGVEPAGPATFMAATGYWYVQHAMVMALYNLDTQRSSSNAVGFSVDWIDGRSPFGQLTEYTTLRAFAIGLQYYW
jgi:hypothetical protein